MKKMKTIMYCLALVAMAGFTSAAFAQEPTLTSSQVRFNTTRDNKKASTQLDVYIKTNHGHEIAKSEGNGGLWKENSTHTITLRVEGRPTKAEVQNGSISLAIHPNGDDTWDFNYRVTLRFSDGSVIRKHFSGGVLTEKDPTRTDSLT
jgi:hypothetical protein